MHVFIFSPAYFPPKVEHAHSGLPDQPVYLRLDSKLQALKGKVLKNSAAVKMLTYLTLTNSQSSQSGVEVVELAATWSARSLSSVMSLKPVCLGRRCRWSRIFFAFGIFSNHLCELCRVLKAMQPSMRQPVKNFPFHYLMDSLLRWLGFSIILCENLFPK